MGPPPVPSVPPMTILPLLFAVPLAALLAQDPAPRRDFIELVGGEILTGRILQERGNYVEIELQQGCVVGFRTAQIASIRRGEAPAAVPVAAAIPSRDEWFLLHDGSGASIGTLHCTVATDSKGITQALEEWEFASGERTAHFTSIARTDAAMRPIDCYFRERVLENAQIGSPLDPMAKQVRVRSERIVEARVEGDLLVVSRLSPTDKKERSMPFPSDATFSLLARELPRRSRPGQPTEHIVFDPAAEDLRTVTFGGSLRRLVEIGGEQRHVEEITEQGPDGRNATWFDAAQGAVRREVSGPALVAVRCDAAVAKNQVGLQRVDRPFTAESGRAFGLWIPNPAWQAEAAERGVALRMRLRDATITLSRLDALDSTSSLDAAAQAVERWSALAHPKLVVTSRAERSLRSNRAVQIETSGGSGNREFRARMVVVEGSDGFLVLRCAAPSSAWDELEADFEAAALRIERTREAVAALEGKKPSDEKATDAAVAPAAPAVEPAPMESASAEPAPIEPTPSRAEVRDAAMRGKKGRVLVPKQDGDQR